MCGLVGYVGSDLDHNLLARAMIEAGRRGPHAFGLAYHGSDAERVVDRWTGPALGPDETDLTHLSPLLDANPHVLVGVGRLATSGTWRDMRNNQPLTSERYAIGHNGNVHNYQQILALLSGRWQPHTANDSETILGLLEHGTKGDLDTRVRSVIKKVSQNPLALIVIDGKQLTSIRRGHPLYCLSRASGFYLCSRKFHPSAELMTDGRVYTFTAPRYLDREGV